MIFAFYILAAMLIYLSYRSLRGGIDYLNFFRDELAKPRSDFTPFASVIVPCKGVDQGLKENLEALLAQDYPKYEVIFVVDDADDAAVPVIRSVSSGAAVIVAPAADGTSQKVENLREAVLHTSPSSQVLVFVDSDARPSPDLLRCLAAALNDEKVGIATGYRWFISPAANFASELRSVWNASIASSLGPGPDNRFCWGGATAIRRDTFEWLGVRDKWRGTVSDDFVLARLVRAAKMPIVFVPQALTPSVEDCTLREVFEFTTRQMKLTRVYAPALWKLSFFGSGVFNLVMLWAISILVLDGGNTLASAAAAFTLFTVSVFSIGKSWLRLRAVALVLPHHREAVRKQVLTQLTFWAITPAVFFYNCVAALISRRIEWRGNRYVLVSPAETVTLRKR